MHIKAENKFQEIIKAMLAACGKGVEIESLETICPVEAQSQLKEDT